MEGAVELAEEIFHMPVRLGAPHNVQGMADVVRNPIYSTAVGLLMYGLQKQSDGYAMAGGLFNDGQDTCIGKAETLDPRQFLNRGSCWRYN